MEDVCGRLTRDDIYTRTGIQCLGFNTVYQLVAHARSGLPAGARLLLMADLCHHMLCGAVVSERTNASTTQLLHVEDGRWDDTLLERLGLPRDLLPEVVTAGTELGTLLPRHQEDLGVGAIRVVAPATHDTASAVAGTPLEPGWAYVSSGTWSLVGVEREAPLLGASAARANVTNEAGAFGTVRVLKNVMGLWILEACRREWQAAGDQRDHAALLESRGVTPGAAGVVFPDDACFFNPPSMSAALRARLAATHQEVPGDPVLLSQVILDSLALRYASVLATIEELAGQEIRGIHVVGGGALNQYLNQATADASGRPVLAGPVEATAVGNILVQAIACGAVSSLSEGRRLVRRSLEPRVFTPQRSALWAEAARRFRDVEGAAR
jgi:rhamnulokinase